MKENLLSAVICLCVELLLLIHADESDKIDDDEKFWIFIDNVSLFNCDGRKAFMLLILFCSRIVFIEKL